MPTIIDTAPAQLGMYQREAVLYLYENGHYSGSGWNWGAPKLRDDVMQSLVNRGLVSREGDAQRLGHYTLTDAGKALVQP